MNPAPGARPNSTATAPTAPSRWSRLKMRVFFAESTAARQLSEQSTAKLDEARAHPDNPSLVQDAQALAKQSALTDAYHRVQLAVGILAATLAPIVAIGYVINGGAGIHGTISSYKYTNMGDYFVGAVFALGVLFLAYEYKPQDPSYRGDMILSNLASALAIGVALCPTDDHGVGATSSHTLVGTLHVYFAGTLFVVLAVFSLFRFTRTNDPSGRPTQRPKIRRNRWYKACGLVIVAACVVAFVNSKATHSSTDVAFASEAVALLAFAGSWLVKCGLIRLPGLSDPAPTPAPVVSPAASRRTPSGTTARESPVPTGVVQRVWMRFAGAVDRRWGWDKVPKVVGVATLIGLRMALRRENLFDTTGVDVGWGPEKAAPDRSLVRSVDGTGTDPTRPQMGSAGTRFGRNVPLADTNPEGLLSPSPRTISNELLARREFLPATSLSLLAAAWIQFEVHDWMSHGANEETDPWQVPLDPDDPWPGRTAEGTMAIDRTRVDTSSYGGPPTYTNTETHWWDASQVYGSTPTVAQLLRTGHGGHLKLDPNGIIPFDPTTMKIPGVNLVGVSNGWWLGLAMLHTLFMREHNAICDHLASAHDDWTDQKLYDTARLVNAALIAKIHTVEWTTALLANPDLELGMRVNWWGLQGESLSRRFGRLSKSEEISGIIGSELYYHGAPFAMTEEFVAVYRMHPLIPDDYRFRSHRDDELIQGLTFTDIAGTRTHGVLTDPAIGMTNLFYSFGTSYPGRIVLHNYPEHMRNFVEPSGRLIDLASVDVLRDRERGVPRYNEFRRRFRLRPADRWEDFNDDPDIVRELRDMYDTPEDVDLIVGLYAETPPTGFAISDTAFRVFLVMASRRLKSDRFYTSDYRPDVYSQEGLDWIEYNSMSSVLLRHYPALADALEGVNPFKPWNTASAHRG